MDAREVLSLVKEILPRPQFYVGYPLQGAGQIEALIGIALSLGRSVSVEDGRTAVWPLIVRATAYLQLPPNRLASLSCESFSNSEIHSYEGLRRNTSRLLLSLSNEPSFEFIEEWRQELEGYIHSRD